MAEHTLHNNQLIHESSPYLLQHAHNPVDWYPWGDIALDKAKEENKLIIISVGYSACHWCHVMEKESFESTEVARVMNDFYVSIKVDREERPDIDQIYMNAIQLLSGQGGWPLNCIALPDGKPVYGGTYFQKQQWIQVLETLQNMWLNEPHKLVDQAEQLRLGINETDLISEPASDKKYNRQDLVSTVNLWKRKFDSLYGGDDYAPKFPMPDNLQFLLQFAALENDKQALDHVLLTLQQMAKGGIYDQLRGGFARYSIDKKWFVPHFEKMLYDNAQLIRLYSKAFQSTKQAMYKTVVYETVYFVSGELTSPEGGFYSALDADSEGEEGKYYVWTSEEIDTILQDDAILFKECYGITDTGNWEHEKNILFVDSSVQEISKKYHLPSEKVTDIIFRCKQKLLEKQNKRPRPLLDDKILTSWNALMVHGLLDAYKVFQNEKFLEMATRNMEFITENLLKPDYRLDRTYKNGTSNINAFLDDYSFLIEALVTFYEVTFQEKWLNTANHLMNYVDRHFYDESSGMYFYTSDQDRALVARKMEISDNVIASSNSSIAKSLFQLGHFMSNSSYLKKSKQMLNNMADEVYKYPKYYSNWAILLLWHSYPFHQIVFSGRDALLLQKEFYKHFIPNHLVAGSTRSTDLPLLHNRYDPNTTKIYVCRNNACQLPVTTVDEALQQLTAASK